MRVLLPGANGLVGRHLVGALAGHETVTTTRAELDITDADAFRRLAARVRPEAIVLAAAFPWVEGCEQDPLSSRRVNVEATRTARDLAREHGAALVVFSTEYVFDGTAGASAEDDPTAPLNEYGRQKVELERIAREWERGLVVRTSGVYGKDPSRKNFVYQVVDRLGAGATFDVPSDQLITPTDAPSLAAAVVELLERGARGIVHVAGPEILERTTFARLICEAYALPAALLRPRPTRELGLRAVRPLRAALRTDKLRALLGHGLPAPAEALAALRAAEA